MKALRTDHNACHPEPRMLSGRGTSQMRKPSRESLAAFFESEGVFASSLTSFGMTEKSL